MWFDNLMDDCKNGLLIADKHKGVFVPIFLRLAMNIIIGVVTVISVIAMIAGGTFAGIADAEPFKIVMSVLVSGGILMLIGYIVYLLLWGLIEVGSINLYRAALNDEKPTKAHFFGGIKSYIGKVFAGKLLIHFVCIIASPILIALYLIFLVLVGIPTGGWGAVFLSVAIGVYFATWTIAIVHDNLSAVQGIKTSFRLARQRFKPLFVIILTSLMIIQFSVSLIGPLGTFFAGWLISGVLGTYFRIVIYMTYMRYSDNEKPAVEVE